LRPSGTDSFRRCYPKLALGALVWRRSAAGKNPPPQEAAWGVDSV
jgi:hypothetical protein